MKNCIYPEVKVQLTGKNGNAFSIIGTCMKAAEKAGISKLERDAFFKEATSGDYDHLLKTAMIWFDVS